MDGRMKATFSEEDSTVPEIRTTTPQITVSSHEDPAPSDAISEASASGSEDQSTTAATTPGPDEPTAPEDIGIATRSGGPSTDGKVLHHSGDVRPFREQVRNVHAPQKGNSTERISTFSGYLRSLEDRIGQLERKSSHRAQGRSTKETVTNHQNRSNSLTNQVELAPKFMLSQEPENFDWEPSGNANHLLEVLCWGGETNEHDLDSTSLRIYELRINSIPFATLLKKVAKYSLHENGSIQMRSPFRLLVRNVHHVREQIEKLLAKFNSKPNEQETVSKEKAEQPAGAGFAIDQIPGATDEELPEEKAYESKEALEHFLALMSFVDKYLCKTMKKYGELQSAARTKAHFEDLWMVFDAGDIIFSPCRRDKTIWIGNASYNRIRKDDPQAYRIVSVTGGRQLPESRRAKVLPHMPPGPPPPPPGQYPPPGPNPPQMVYLPHQGYDEFSPLVIDCYGLDFNGMDYGISGGKFRIDPYEDETAINSLEAYPLRFSEEGGLQQRLVDRGRKFIQLSEVSHRFYEGLTFGEDREEICGQVVVDFALAYQDGGVERPRLAFPPPMTKDPREDLEITRTGCDVPGCRVNSCKRLDSSIEYERKRASDIASRALLKQASYKRQEATDKTKIEQLQKKLEDDAMLLPGVVPAFVLRNRKWAQLNIDLVQKIDRQKNGFDDLVLPPGHKRLVQALVQTHATGARSATGEPRSDHQVDLVRGKGKGCIILLHGAPGVGKTSTAGDIGYDTDQVERNLAKHFTLAHKWGCVMLLDEADVFLTKRNKEDLRRNGLVSVFLRVLEYYSGILFLTTNRVGTFDDAFKSRVHLSLYYPALDEASTTKVWEMNLARTIKNKKEFRVEEGQILRFAKANFEELSWNGRQIKNAFQTAIALAEFKANERKKKPVMSAEEFRVVAEASRGFDQYLKMTLGKEESFRAGREGVRYDGQLQPLSKLKLPRIDLPSSDSSSTSSSSEDSDDESLTKEERKEKKRLRKEKKKQKKAKKREKKRSARD
ncbi:MAG: hypothetical protein M1840_007540 [Geoglossum simile]|nr:MAG: hypothetical protein M1840_007540 [Geoglossum simile]